MRVALLSHSARAGDAIGRQIAAKVAFFRDRGASVRLFVETDRNLAPGLAPFAQRRPDERFLADCDLILVEYSQSFASLDLLPRLAGGRPRVVFDYHGVTPPRLGAAGHRDALDRGCRMRGLAAFADAALAHSRFAARELGDAGGVTADILGYPVDLDFFTPGAPATDLRRTLGLDASATLLVFAGRLAPNKRVPLLVDALAHLDADVHAVIVGDCGDAYEAERQRVRERVARRGVAGRVHFLGHVTDEQLRDAYRSADVFVMPSVHEGFCLPVAEAMACGTPVVAARAAALPETVADAGLTFAPDDAADFAKAVTTVVRSARQKRPPAREMRVAVVAARYGDGFAGGAETSLRAMANALAAAGHSVTVFTTAGPDASEIPTVIDGLTVHRLRREPADDARREQAAAAIRAGTADAEAVETYFQHSPRSPRLVAALRERGPFDAILVGPYLTGLTRDVAAAFPAQTLLAPCFHDEPLARRPEVVAAYAEVGGVLYHSAEERAFAEAELGLNHPNAHVVGTLVDVETPGDARRGRRIVGTGRRYVLSVGRFAREKGLPELIAFARRYCEEFPERFTFAFAGEGEPLIPNEPWARDLGYVTSRDRRDLTAGAAALVTLSRCESLSLAVLEAHAQGVPAIVRADCAATAAHARRGGGVAVDGYEDFAAALDDLWRDPAHWADLGRRGREYVRTHFADPATFAQTLTDALDGLGQPVAVRLRANGLRRAQSFSRQAWREAFAAAIERVLDAPRIPKGYALDVRPRVGELRGAGTSLFAPVRVDNRGQLPELGDGTRLVTRAYDADGTPAGPEAETALPTMILPGQSAAAVARVATPPTPGRYVVAISVRRGDGDATPELPDVRLPLTVTDVGDFAAPPPVARPVEAVDLPDGYVDVSEGFGARLKHWAKRKLLHNFQHAYVNVLSRQQSAFNRNVAAALAELADAQAAVAQAAHEAASLREEVARLRRQNRALARRLARLESGTETPA